MSNQIPNDPQAEITDTVKHRRTEDNLGVIWVWVGVLKARVQILEYKVEKDNNMFYDLRCRMNSTDEKLEYRLAQLEKLIDGNARQIKERSKDYWGVFAGIFTAVISTVLIQYFARR